MWNTFASFILKYRLAALIALFTTTAFMAWNGQYAKLSYQMSKMVPDDDKDFIDYQNFKKRFGEDGNKLLIAFNVKDLYTVNTFNKVTRMVANIQKVKGVSNVLSPLNYISLTLDTSEFKFRLVDRDLNTNLNKKNLVQYKTDFESIKFYDQLIYNKSEKSVLIAVSLDKRTLNSENRLKLTNDIKKLALEFGKSEHTQIHISGLPYIRNTFSTEVKDELLKFTLIAFFITLLIFVLFFRSRVSLLIAVGVVGQGIAWSIGIIALLGFKLTLLIGLIPPLVVVISVPNCIYLINKYHDRIRQDGDKTSALKYVISRIGIAALLTNFTTAVGFGVFYFTKTQILLEFGVVAFLSIMSIFIISIVFIPIILSYSKIPTDKETNHLKNKVLGNLVDWIHFQVFNHKRRIYFYTVVVMLTVGLGLYKLKPLAYMLDDIPHSDRLYKDLKYFEKNFNGVMPLEIIVDALETDGIKDLKTLKKISKLQKKLKDNPAFSRSLAITDIIKYSNQVYKGGNPKYYRLPNSLDYVSIASMMPEEEKGKKNLLGAMVDADYRRARISVQMKDVGSIKLKILENEVKAYAKKIFPAENYNVIVTGTTPIFLKGNSYLVKSLIKSLLLAFLLIAIIMAALFTSFKMVLVALIPNMIPLVITSGLMGHFGVPLKPSTILIFSVAFGISVDDTIHFLSKFKQEVRNYPNNIKKALSVSLRETGFSMIYTSIVLFFGFIIFAFSHFEGTIFLGILTSVTLITAVVSNLFLLPALILSYEKRLNPKEELKDNILDINAPEK